MAEVLVAEVESDPQPWAGRRDRSSANFSLAGIPDGVQELLWLTEPHSAATRFSVMSDVRANFDQRVLSNVASGSKTRIPRERESLSRRGFYIANPSGSTEPFTVRVYAVIPD
ncbi:hypothetical protein [Nocardia veterana]|uniref:DeoR family transcriptional regulator n=1 Tax=Nocardia veterana TaxID=132249 RepID=A0A7X6LU35_9NOCA|nr:hypothetical protein [Nocardia veterana]NKY84057.1 DeoR family transcriptional regulator [Nocardia veterana]